MLEKIVTKENFSLDTKASPATPHQKEWQYRGMCKQIRRDPKKKTEEILCYDCYYVPSSDNYVWAKRP